MDREHLLRCLHSVEGEDLEFKSAAGGVPEDAYRTIGAFANTAGGWLILGVSERMGRYEVTGVADPDRVQSDVINTCRSADKVTRHLDLVPRIHHLDGRAVVCFYVAPLSRLDRPVRVRVRKGWETLVRVGSGDHLCSPVEEARFLRDASTETWDSQPAEGLTLDHLDPASIRWFRALLAERDPARAALETDDAAWLEQVGLVQGRGGLTVAAALLFGRDPAVLRYKPAGVLDLRYHDELWDVGPSDRRWDDRLLLDQNLVGVLRAAFDRFLRWLPQPFALEATGQRRALSPDFAAAREALVNLLVHQDYADPHRTARLVWMRDRVLFENPGDSYTTVAQMLDGGVSQLRNPLLARLFRMAGFAEQAGTGMGLIVRRWRAAERVPPDVQNDPGRKQYALTLTWAPMASPEDTRWLEGRGLRPTDDMARLLLAARQRGVLRWADARLAVGGTGAHVSTLLAHAVSHGWLAPSEGAPDRWRWAPGAREPELALLEEPRQQPVYLAAAPPPRRGEPAPDRARILRDLIAQTPGVRVPGLVTRTGWTEITVKRALAELRARGEVAGVGATRNGGYHRVD